MIEMTNVCLCHSTSKCPKMVQVSLVFQLWTTFIHCLLWNMLHALESDTNIGVLYQGSKRSHSVEHNFFFGGSRFAGRSSYYDTQQYNVDR
jgi:hypothetical protein